MITGALWKVNSEMLDGKLAKEMNIQDRAIQIHIQYNSSARN